MAKLLLDNGANINLIDQAGYTELHCAVRHHNLKLVKFLLDNGANINLTNSMGETALHQVIETYVLKKSW